MLKTIVLAVLAVNSAQADQRVINAFQSARIVPKWVPASPSVGMRVEFPSSVLNVMANYGNKLELADLASMPYTQWDLPADDFIRHYTLLAIDLDAPNSADGTGYLLWLNSNITGDYAGDLDFEYERPRGVGHRIAFLVFYQKAFLEYNDRLIRHNFNVADYIAKNALTIWAGNFFYTK